MTEARTARHSLLRPTLSGCGLALLGVAGCVQTSVLTLPLIYPAALRPGDTVAFVAPAGPLDRTRMELARTRLEAMGFVVRVPPDLYRTRGYLAGTDDQRADELMAAFADPEIAAVFPGTGGYGTTRILDRLDFDVIRRNPKVYIGFSDITALHLAIQRKTGLITFHSPSPMWGLGSPLNLSDFSADYLWRAMLEEKYLNDDGHPLPPGYALTVPEKVASVRTIAAGVGSGRLTGGNLSLIIALMGTEFEIQTTGRVLLLEDVGERPYRIDRYLSQLRLAGKLDDVAAVILGSFRDCNPDEGKPSLTLERVFLDYFEHLGVPVIADFPAGHSRFNATLPFGAMVEVDANTRRVTVIENPVTLRFEP